LSQVAKERCRKLAWRQAAESRQELSWGCVDGISKFAPIQLRNHFGSSQSTNSFKPPGCLCSETAIILTLQPTGYTDRRKAVSSAGLQFENHSSILGTL